MDLRVYYQKLRQVEASLDSPQVVVISLATPNGGRAGVTTEVPRAVAAKMIVGGSARQASVEEAEDFVSKKAEARRAAEQAAVASRIQVTVVSETDAKKASSGQKGTKGQ